ncbi:CAP domain-containing protein [Bacillus massilinigeriensis]|uniref:CAP domain-containing protein n=1 Tax=Bacillus mediterraneensis TaxID=1805474 RepID=UPI001F2DD621|nr:CAP domain-containing protein [Bacillus mediterraneensis]
MDKTLNKNNNQNKGKGTEHPLSGLASYIGKDVSYLIAILGQPSRTDQSPYDFHWLIFNEKQGQYVQAGVKDGKLVTIYAVGEKLDTAPFKIGDPAEKIFSSHPVNPVVEFNDRGSSYKFEMSEDDMNTRPLVSIGNIFAQLYIDRFTGKLSSIRFLDGETLLKQLPYEVVYRGTLVEATEPSEKQWEEIQESAAKQILEITNIFRERHKLKPLAWDEKTAEAAFLHSREMEEEDYFSHTSKEHGDLSDRLEEAGVDYELAGENIAANYSDAPEVTEGWMNSEGHREALLGSEYTHIGVGVYRKHYTQNFILKP